MPNRQPPRDPADVTIRSNERLTRAKSRRIREAASRERRAAEASRALAAQFGTTTSEASGSASSPQHTPLRELQPGSELATTPIPGLDYSSDSDYDSASESDSGPYTPEGSPPFSRPPTPPPLEEEETRVEEVIEGEPTVASVPELPASISEERSEEVTTMAGDNEGSTPAATGTPTTTEMVAIPEYFRPTGADLKKTPQALIDEIKIPDPVETDTEKAQRLTRASAGAATEADKLVAEADRARTEALRKKEALIAYYNKWSFADRAGARTANVHTVYGTDGRLVAPSSYREIATTHPLFKYYVSDTEINALDTPAAIISLCDMLNKINGEDAYSNEAASLGRITEKEYLVLPSGLPIPEVPVNEVGKKEAITKFNAIWLMAVYALNKQVCVDKTGDNPIRFGLARMEAVKLGWYDNQTEVKMEDAPENLVDIINEDHEKMEALVERARDAAWLVPLASEHTFRTKGHHFISGQRAEYTSAYEALFKAALKNDVATYLPADLLYHSAFHWITPKRVWAVLKANLETAVIPDAIKLRATSAPAGAALITTTAATLRAFASAGFYEEFKALKVANLGLIEKTDDEIREDPPKYHKTPTAYGRPYLTAAQRADLEKVKEEAKKIAPVMQGFCETILRNAPLGKQKVLAKHSDDNPTIRQRAKRFFLQMSKGTPASLSEVFGGAVKKSRIVGASGAGDVSEEESG